MWIGDVARMRSRDGRRCSRWRYARWTGAFTLFAVIALATPAARADEVLAPVDGAQVGSLPTFAFTLTNGAVDVELSRTPDVKVAGEDAGAFVDDTGPGFYFLLYRRSPRDGLGVATRPLHAGTWYWHERARNDDLGDAAEMGPWGTVRRLVVEDETPIFEGWTLQAQRLARRGSCRRVRLRGRLVWSDNDDTPHVKAALRVRGELQGTVRTLVVRFGEVSSSQTYDRVVCAPAPGRLRVTPEVIDEAWQQARGPVKIVP